VAADMQPGALAHGDSQSALSSPRGNRSGRRGLFSKIRTYYRETVSELRKVIYPTRSELLTYTGVVLGFVSIMVAIVFGLDILFAKLDLFLFGK
jgi:preprotein translocase subunit SecE